MNHPETQTQHNRVQNMQEVGLPLPHFGARLGEIVAILRGNKDDINNVLRGYCSSSYQQHPLIDCIRYHGQTFWRNLAGPQSTVFFCVWCSRSLNVCAMNKSHPYFALWRLFMCLHESVSHPFYFIGSRCSCLEEDSPTRRMSPVVRCFDNFVRQPVKSKCCVGSFVQTL